MRVHLKKLKNQFGFFLCAFFFLLNVQSTFGFDQSKVEQLRKQLTIAKPAQQVQLYLELATTYGKDEPASATTAAEAAFSITKKHNLKKQLLRAELELSKWMRQNGGQYATAKAHLENVYRKAQQTKETILFEVLLEKAAFAKWEYKILESELFVEKAYELFKDKMTPQQTGAIFLLKSEKSIRNREYADARNFIAVALEQFEKLNDYNGKLQAIGLLMEVEFLTRSFSKFDSLYTLIVKDAEKLTHNYWKINLDIRLGSKMILASSEMQLGFDLEKLETELDKQMETVKNQSLKLEYLRLKMKLSSINGATENNMKYAQNRLGIAKSVQLKSSIVRSTMDLGSCYMNEGKVDVALELLLNLEPLVFETGCDVDQFYLRLGELYSRMGDEAVAMDVNQKALAYMRKQGTHLRNHQLYVRIAVSYRKVDSLDLALAYYDTAEIICKSLKMNNYLVGVYTGKGFVHNLRNEPDRTEKELLKSIAIIQNHESEMKKQYISYTYMLAAQFYYDEMKYNSCILYADKARKINEKIQWMPALADSYDILSKAYAKSNDYKTAMGFLKQHTQLKDSLTKTATNEEILALKEQYQSEQSKLEIELLQQDKLLNERTIKANKDTIKRGKWTLWVVAVSVVVLLVVALLLFNRFKLKKRTHELMLTNKAYQLKEEHSKVQQQLELAELRSSFMTNVSHDIRTPLSLIKGPMEQLRKDPSKLNKSVLETMERNVDRLMSLMNNAIQFSSSKEYSFTAKQEVVSVFALLSKVSKSFRVKSEQSKIQLLLSDYTNERLWTMDGGLMERALTNLVSNAMHYTNSGGTITLTSSVKKMQEEMKV